MLAIDVFQQYNTVTDWAQIKADGVGAVWVKLTDGSTQASTHGDTYVNAARSAGIAVGGYHFAEASSSPEIQADTLANEIRRLNAVGVAPMLDLESNAIVDPENFRVRFWQHFNQVLALGKYLTYASESWWTSGRLVDAPVVAGELIWVARYGSNSGTDQGTSLADWDVHQYTSVGVLAGAHGFLDLDNVRTNVFLDGTPLPAPPPATDWVSTIMARLPVLQQGAQDAPTGVWYVRRLQALLRGVFGYAIAIDGDFGPVTTTTVREFQSTEHLQVDGVVGAHSWSVLVTGANL